MTKRPDWDEYFMNIVEAVSARATCDRGKNAALIVKNKRIMSTGYVGSPIGLPHCDDVGHLMRDVLHTDGQIRKHCVRTTHAEANAVAQAARHGVSIDGGTIYTKMFPCLDCTKLIINAGIKRVVAKTDYHAAHDSKEFLKQANVELHIMTKDTEKYDNQ